mgnify:CR=1 FL=1
MSAHSGGKRTKAAPRNKIWVAILALLTVLLLWSALRAEAVPAGQGIVPQAAYLDTSGPLYHYTDPTGDVIARTGVDVSSYQGDIDWNAVREAGAEFAIVRVGFRGYGTGRLVLDSSFRKNIEGARAAGLQVGVYFFSQAVNEKEAIEEASMCVQYAQGYQVDMPIFIDLEDVWDPDDGSGGRANNLSVTQRTSVARAFCDTVRGAGYKAGIYASYYYLLDRMHIGQLEGDNYIWMASYADSTSYPRSHDMWQYTDNGRVPGITTWDGRAASVDMNVWYE